MNILFFSDNFPPETNAPASRLYEHARYWTGQGHAVSVLTCAPNFPEGKVYPGYRNRRSVEQMDGIRVVRVKTYITANEGFLRRSADYASFMVSSFFAGLFEKRPDLVVATSPQFFTAIGAWAVACLKRRPFIFEVRDLWPASIVAVGAMRSGFVIRCLEKLELFLYRQASRVIVVTNGFKADLVGRGIPPEKIRVVMNGVDLSRFSPQPKDEVLTEQYGLKGKFVVGYIGTQGMAHGLEHVLKAAGALQSKKDIVFLFVGGGAGHEKLIAEAERMKLSNVTFVSSQPKEKMPAIWSLCDAALIHLKNEPLFKAVIPSKIFEAMGMGLPILLAVPEGESASIVREAEAGFVIEPENTEALIGALERLREDAALKNKMAQASHAASPNFDRRVQAKKMLDVFQGVLS